MKPTLCIELTCDSLLVHFLFLSWHHFVCPVHPSVRLRQTLKILFNLLTSRINDISVFTKRLSLFKKKGHAVFLIIIVLTLPLAVLCYESSHGQPFYFKSNFC